MAEGNVRVVGIKVDGCPLRAFYDMPVETQVRARSRAQTWLQASHAGRSARS